MGSTSRAGCGGTVNSPEQIRFAFADAVPLAAVCEAFNLGFSDYKYGVQFDETQMERFLERSDVLRENSAVMLARGDQGWHGAGLALMGLDGECHAWCSGLAVVPALRNRGHARTLIEMIQHKASERGAVSMQLEVLIHNAPALHLYHRLGYTPRRNLNFWRATPETLIPSSTAGDLTAANAADFLDTLYGWQAEPPAWQRTQRSVERYLSDLWGYAMLSGGEPAGYVACLPTAPNEPGKPRVRIMAMAVHPAGDCAARANRLIASLRAHLPDTTISIINEPENSLFATALAANGFDEVDRQIEMWLELDDYPRNSS